MIIIVDKKDCCGCFSCVNTCPQSCIKMSEDEEGFFYPEIDVNLCVNCGLCEKACPTINEISKPQKPIKIYAAKNNNTDIVKTSSSGGIFTAIAEEIIAQDGIVCGAMFNNNWEIVHMFISNKHELAFLRGSKYIQSYIGESFKRIKQYLENGRKVLFSGTPCQVKGLKLFLKKEYCNLITTDFVCHGVPSQKIWNLYLNEIKATYGESTNRMAINYISFRNKSKGWNNYRIIIKAKKTRKNSKAINIVDDKHHRNLFMKGFLNNLYLRPSCYSCPAKRDKSGSDITLADFWGIAQIAKDWDDNKGTSLVMINSTKGMKYFPDKLIKYKDFSLKQAENSNVNICNSSIYNNNREKFFKAINGGKSFSKTILELCFKPRERYKMKVYITLKRIYLLVNYFIQNTLCR